MTPKKPVKPPREVWIRIDDYGESKSHWGSQRLAAIAVGLFGGTAHRYILAPAKKAKAKKRTTKTRSGR